MSSHRWNELSQSTVEELEYIERRAREYSQRVRRAEAERDALAAELAALRAKQAAQTTA